MKTILITIALLMACLGFSQTRIKKSSIDSAGNLSQNGSITMLSTVGELAVQENTNANIYISEGFISPITHLTLNTDNYKMLKGVKIYPNPAVNFVNVEIDASNNIEIILYDETGKTIYQENTSMLNNFKINMSSYEFGTYLLLIKDEENKLYETYKIIKQ